MDKINQEADSPEELLDLVDDRDNIIGTITRREVYLKGLKNYRVVHAFIKNKDGKLWIPRRVPTKKLYPSALDFSIAGHVESGETYDEAIKKEAREEVRLNLDKIPYRELTYLSPHTDGVGVWQRIYEIESSVVPDYDQVEFSDYEWLSPEEIITRYDKGEAMKSDIPVVVRHCYLT